MPSKNKKSIDENVEKYEKYFKEDLDAIEEELNKSKQYTELIDREITKLTKVSSLGSNKGAERQLIDHITNAVQLQTQRQGLRKDKFTIKKAILEYALKFAEDNKDTGTSDNYLDIVMKLLDKEKEAEAKKDEKISLNEQPNADAEIDKILEEGGE